MTVLVTGGAGYIGSHMVLALVEAGESVVVIDNLSTGFSAFLPESVPLFIGDAGDENLVEGVIQQHNVESIIHFAGYIVVPDSMRDPLGYYRNNTMTTRSLLNAAVKSGINRFIFSSTAAVYGTPETLPIAEEAPTLAINPYGASKLMTETMLHYGPDSFPGFLVCVINGSSETTFYVLALYLGSVGVRASRHTVLACLAADFAGVAAALAASRVFY